ncbi:MAG: hypothetical protein IPO29_10925 [Anaerolineae bacterium]|nr:hypothetical protein [Anaerolineae bacterium]
MSSWSAGSTPARATESEISGLPEAVAGQIMSVAPVYEALVYAPALPASAPALPASAPALPAPLAPEAVGTREAITKTGTLTNTTYNAFGQITSGQLSWRIKYATLGATSVLTNVRITDTLGAGQVLVPGSVRYPQDWYFGNPSANTLIFTDPFIADRAQGVAIKLKRPPANLSAGGGDGFQPTLLPDGRVVGIFHHDGGLGSGTPTLWCFDTDGNACPGYPRESIETPQAPWSANVGTKFYYRALTSGGATGAGDPALACWDFTTNYLCSTTGIISGTNKYPPVALSNGTMDYSGPRELGGKLYTVWGNGRLDCIDPATNTQCAGYTTNTVTNTLPGTWDGTSPDADMVAINGKLYILSGFGGGGKQTYCWDPTLNGGTGGRCTGFNSVPGNTGTDIILRPNVSGTIIGFCAVAAGASARCWDLNGTTTTTVASLSGFSDEPDDRRVMNDITFGARTFWPTGGGVECYDWKTSARCANFPVATGLKPYGWDGPRRRCAWCRRTTPCQQRLRLTR